MLLALAHKEQVNRSLRVFGELLGGEQVHGLDDKARDAEETQHE